MRKKIISKKNFSVKNSGYSHYGANRIKPSVSAWNSLSKSPAEDISDNLELLRERSRDLYTRVPAFGRLTGRKNILHLLPMERIGQHRGVPFLAPVIETLKQLGRYSDAELMAAVIGGIFAIFFTHNVDDDSSMADYIGEESISGEVEARKQKLEELAAWKNLINSFNIEDMMYGGAMDLPEGTKPASLAPARPNSAFNDFIMSLARQLGSALDIPAEVLLLNFTSSYSASRGALLEAWKLFRYWRGWWVTNFCQPIYEEWLRFLSR